MSHFAKRHYEAIATTMQRLHPGEDGTAIDYDARLEMWNDTVTELASTFMADNPAFDHKRFAFACEVGSNVKAKTAHLRKREITPGNFSNS